jgi:hypothetical protein
MPADYSFEKRAPGCTGCGRPFAVGEEYHSALVVDVTVRAGADGESPPEPPELPESGGDEPTPPPEPEAPDPEAGEGGLPFRRLDLCPACWERESPGEYFCCWRSAVPEPQEENRSLAKRIDVDTIYDMFRRLEGHADPAQRKFRFILGLMLMRRKRLKFTGVVDSPQGEHLVLEDRDEGVNHKVLDPGLAEEEIDSLRGQIDRLLGVEPEPDEEAPAGSAASAPEGEGAR